MGIIGECLDEIEWQKTISQYYSNGGTLITENAYSVIPKDSMFIGYFIAESDMQPSPQSELGLVGEGREVGTFKKKRRFDVYVNGNEGKNIRHFHVVAHDDSGDETCVQIETNRYFTHGNKTYLFNNKECKALNDFVRQPKKFGRFLMTTYEYIVYTWNEMNNDGCEVHFEEETEQPIIPNYSSIVPYK